MALTSFHRAVILCLAVAACFALLAACGTTGIPVVEEKIVRVNVPVPVGCVKTREGEVVPLNKRYTREQWAALQPSQKAGALGVNAVKRLNREQLQDATISACPDAPP